MAGFGVLEASPHNNVHRCVGSVDCNYVDAQGFMTDMMSPVDPLFFLHHANIDRLWDVWTRKQVRLGLPTLPDGAALRTDAPDDRKSDAEKNTDYYRWASEPMLFFVDGQGRPVDKTRGGDYESMAFFNYDYEPGAGEDVVAKAARPAARRVVAGKVTSRLVQGSGQPASATVQLPAAMATAGAGTTLVANVTLNFPQMSHRAFAVLLGGPDDAAQVDPASPFYLATLSMFGHHGACGALTYAVPLGAKLDAARKLQSTTLAASADGTLKLRIMPLPAGGSMAGMEEIGTVELLGVSVESY
jgi:tyrosinase